MKNYTDYMDNISVDTALHETIMKQMTVKPTPPYRNRTIVRFAGLTACAAVLLICVWLVPGLFHTPAPNTPNHPSVLSSDEPQSSTSPETTKNPPLVENTEIPDQPGEEWQVYTLTLNKVDSLMPDASHVPGFLYFWYRLTDAQAEAVLSEYPFIAGSTAYYNSDGTLWYVNVNEQAADGSIAMFGEYYTMTEIQFAPGEIMDDVIYNYEAVVSDVLGIHVTAGVFEYDWVVDTALYIASFEMDGISYSVKLHDRSTGESGPSRLNQIVNKIIRNGAPDLTVFNNPIIPELRYEQLTLKEAQSDPDFGVYLPKSIPTHFSFETAQRFINQETNSLSVNWHAGLDYTHWRVFKPTEYDREHIVLANEFEKYDLSLYPIPRAESVPDELRKYVDNPVFLAEELTLEIIKTRAYQINDAGDTPGWRMNFSVLYDDVIVGINAKGVSPEHAWEMIEGLMN